MCVVLCQLMLVSVINMPINYCLSEGWLVMFVSAKLVGEPFGE